MTVPPTKIASQSDLDERPSAERRSRWSRWRWWLAIPLLLAIVHVPVLKGFGDWMRGDDGIVPVDAVVVLSGDHRYAVAGDLREAGMVHQVWTMAEQPTYPVVAGVVRPVHEVAMTALIDEAVPVESIVVLPGEATDVTDVIRAVGERMRTSDTTRVLLLCRGFDAKHHRLMVDGVLPTEIASRIRVKGLPYDAFDEDRWWRSRRGWKEVFGRLGTLTFTLLMGTAPYETPAPIDPDEYERQLKRQFGEAACHEF